MSVSIRAAVAADRDALRALLPRLAEFEVPARRNPEDLWRGDEVALLQCLEGHDDTGLVHVAVDARDQICGLVFTRLRPELLSGKPSAHMEALAVAEGMEGQGIASQLVAATEAAAAARGASSITLTVFSCNTRARGLYDKLGYDPELIRAIKDLD